MSRNLRNKIGILLDDIETLSRSAAVFRVEEFLKAELDFSEAEHIITRYDLTTIKSLAVSRFVNEPLTPTDPLALDQDLFRTKVYVDAVINFLRAKKLIAFNLTFNPKKR